MNSIADTHRLSYRNARITAVSFGTQTPIGFYNADGTLLANTLSTDAAGFVFYGDGAHSANGYFVKEKATVTATMDSGSVQWNIDKTLDESDIGNGEVVSAKTNAAVWTANSSEQWKPSWDDLWNKPTLGTWTESQVNAGIKSWGQVITIPKDCTILRLDDHSECIGRSQCSYRKAIQLTAPQRAGQQLIIINSAGSDISLWNTPVTITPETVDQYTGAISAIGNYEGVVLAAVMGMDDNSSTYKWVAVTDTSLVKQSGSQSFNGLQYYNFASNTLYSSVNVSASTNVLIVSGDAGTSGHALKLTFNKAGQTVAIVNYTDAPLYLSNSVPTALNESSSVAMIPGYTSAAIAARKNVCMVASGILNDTILFWADSMHSDSNAFVEFNIPVGTTGGDITSTYTVDPSTKVLCVSANTSYQNSELLVELKFTVPGQNVCVINNTVRKLKLYNVYPQSSSDGLELTTVNYGNAVTIVSGLLADSTAIRFWVVNPSKVQTVILPDQTVEYNASSVTTINNATVQTFVRDDTNMTITVTDPEVYSLIIASGIDTLQIVKGSLTVTSLPTPVSGSWTIVHKKTVRVLNTGNISGKTRFVRKIHGSNISVRLVQTLANPENGVQYDFDSISGFYEPKYCTLIINGDTWSTPTEWNHPVTEWQAK